jgi:hypothetical protein
VSKQLARSAPCLASVANPEQEAGQGWLQEAKARAGKMGVFLIILTILGSRKMGVSLGVGLAQLVLTQNAVSTSHASAIFATSTQRAGSPSRPALPTCEVYVMVCAGGAMAVVRLVSVVRP